MDVTIIQKTAPGPPLKIATATPATFAVPTRYPITVQNVANGEIPASESFAPNNN